MGGGGRERERGGGTPRELGLYLSNPLSAAPALHLAVEKLMLYAVLVALKVMYIDYGNTECVPLDKLCAMSAVDMQEPAQAFECFLSGIKPLPPFVHWSQEASGRLREVTEVDGLHFKQMVIRVRLWGGVWVLSSS